METGSMATELLGKSVNDVRQKLGDPIREEQFVLGTAVLEFRVELTNFFDEARRKNNPPDILEATWSLSPDENLTLWFSKPEDAEGWHALHFFTWHPDDQF